MNEEFRNHRKVKARFKAEVAKVFAEACRGKIFAPFALTSASSALKTLSGFLIRVDSCSFVVEK